ncbi:MAG: GntR family transcriptional regulator [Candidatus Delongbacteria bacterium]|nr:GntR family transcriptional regulator [Candidatus Delongbacteria bacterium]MBN2835713.1 GntR family transcriptional regulator [Candidatus Delongbacteria bacterium]
MTNTTFMLTVKTSSTEPIYLQLYNQFIRLISSGSLKAGESLPSVRNLATHLSVNPMTISKCYSMLEKDGFVDRQRGIGMTVCELKNRDENIAEMIIPEIDDLITHSIELGLNKDEFLSLIHKRYNEEK